MEQSLRERRTRHRSGGVNPAIGPADGGCRPLIDISLHISYLAVDGAARQVFIHEINLSLIAR
jgi:hypothetical protein